MARNIEIKAVIDNLENIYNKIKQASDNNPELLMQKDTFYNFPLGRLKLRQINDLNSEVIFYIRPNTKGPKKSQYYRFKISNPNLVDNIFRFVFGVKGVIKKRREVFFINRTRIHIDSVDFLGKFIELEVVLLPNETVSQGMEIAKELVTYLNINGKYLIEKSYLEMLAT